MAVALPQEDWKYTDRLHADYLQYERMLVLVVLVQDYMTYEVQNAERGSRSGAGIYHYLCFALLSLANEYRVQHDSWLEPSVSLVRSSLAVSRLSTLCARSVRRYGCHGRHLFRIASISLLCSRSSVVCIQTLSNRRPSFFMAIVWLMALRSANKQARRKCWSTWSSTIRSRLRSLDLPSNWSTALA